MAERFCQFQLILATGLVKFLSRTDLRAPSAHTFPSSQPRLSLSSSQCSYSSVFSAASVYLELPALLLFCHHAGTCKLSVLSHVPTYLCRMFHAQTCFMLKHVPLASITRFSSRPPSATANILFRVFAIAHVYLVCSVALGWQCIEGALLAPL
ncbi:hypothetical protein BCR37DRAFT_290756 [Protomyces lactucae-debilis]|uniref:Uncharacterized protein n=1 Tax=Protomyces lactucae-debilis TaxID=2754530 RepID=A0A1Y2FGG9_PROLT|nr:uncharacterized protein BCR37DRAFT_290756 [Protomyces lactucae-debilis]ORY83040.1 hypothetical protein BCR37DRAFT_290756 [Protomyces lactucae-debilis]